MVPRFFCARTVSLPNSLSILNCLDFDMPRGTAKATWLATNGGSPRFTGLAFFRLGLQAAAFTTSLSGNRILGDLPSLWTLVGLFKWRLSEFSWLDTALFQSCSNLLEGMTHNFRKIVII